MSLEGAPLNVPFSETLTLPFFPRPLNVRLQLFGEYLRFQSHFPISPSPLSWSCAITARAASTAVASTAALGVERAATSDAGLNIRPLRKSPYFRNDRRSLLSIILSRVQPTDANTDTRYNLHQEKRREL